MTRVNDKRNEPTPEDATTLAAAGFRENSPGASNWPVYLQDPSAIEDGRGTREIIFAREWKRWYARDGARDGKKQAGFDDLKKALDYLATA